ncbi:uncharacterized protein LOC132703404 [Cylas formicarius]|uniref:uncharacterized protein LOC132703404 n=1 Tax=Cylas formicarius TaxID=197179 RepID=UPI0029584233|nr:uncharacterized protein LOC132703404 [Cylas formicarius]
MAKIFINILALAVIFQIAYGDDHIEKCKQKIIEQANNVKLGRFPACFDKDKLKVLKNDTKTLSQYYDQLPPECKRPTPQTVSGCYKHYQDLLSSKSDNIKTTIVSGIHSLFDAVRGCVDDIVGKFQNLDSWVLQGCP